MTTFFRVYSIVLISFVMFSLLQKASKDINTNKFWYDIIGTLIMMPIWYYVVFYSIAV